MRGSAVVGGGGLAVALVAAVVVAASWDRESGGPAVGRPPPAAVDDGSQGLSMRPAEVGAGRPGGTASGGSSTEVVGDAEPEGVVLMWARGGLPGGLVARAAELDDVVAAVAVRSDTLGLVGSRGADGQEVDAPPDGFRVPLGVAAVEPDVYAATVSSEGLRRLLAVLEPGRVLLTEAAADLRDVGVGGEIDLVGRPELVVAGVLPAGVLARSEILAHASDADALGLPETASLVVRHEAAPGAATERLMAALEELVPDGLPARTVDASGDDRPQRVPLVLSLVEIKQRFGEFAYRPRQGVREIEIEAGFVDEQIVTESVPILGTVKCHRAIMEDLRSALAEIVAAGLDDGIDPARYGGCFHPRRISADRDRLSSHAWGIAVDVNVDLALPGLGPVPPDEVIDAFARNGFRWGGDFLQPDNHHFEWVGRAALERPER